MRVIGIDPGTRNVGFGIVEEVGNSYTRIAGGCIKTRGDNIATRLVQIHKGIQDAIREHSPTEAAIESVFAGENLKTAIAIGEGRGVAVLSAAELGLEVYGYEPAVIKRSIAGSGRAGKEQIQEMVKVLLCLPEVPETDHEADALAMAITHLRRKSMPAAITPPRKSTKKYGRKRRSLF